MPYCFVDSVELAGTGAGEGAALVGFEQGGTGAVARTASDKLREIVSVKDFGAIGDGVTDETAAIQAAINYAIANLCELRFPAGNYAVTGLTASLTSGVEDCGLVLKGDGSRATELIKSDGSTTPVLTISHSTQPTTANIDISDIAFTGNGKAADAIRLAGVASARISRCFILACDVGISGLGLINSEIKYSYIAGCNTGVKLRANVGTTAYSNANTIRNSAISDNTSFGVDFGQGSTLRIRDCDIERNGTAADTATGGVIVRDTVDHEIGVSMFVMDGCWLEGNKGRALQFEAVGGTGLVAQISNTNILSSESGRAIYAAGGGIFTMAGVQAGSSGDTFDITCSRLTLLGCYFSALAGTVSEPVLSINTAFGGTPVEGNIGRDAQIGGGYALKLTWANGAGGYQLKPNVGTGNFELTTIGGASGKFTFDGNVSLASGKTYQVNGTQVLTARKPGWTAPTGTALRSGFDTSTATLAQVAQTLKALIDDLHSTSGHGLVGT